MSGTLPSVTQHLKAYGISANKRLGQHFLTDPHLLEKIARSAGVLAGKHVLEIGPGPGGLSRAILAQNPASLTVIERDPQFTPLLHDIATQFPALRLIEGDALLQDYAAFAPPAGKHHLVANLPYNIGTELLFHWLKTPQLFARMSLLLQKEVALRLAASAGNKHYGWLSIITQLYCDVSYDFTVAPEAFHPPPKVDSAVIHLTPLDTPRFDVDVTALRALCQTAFQQRRKMLRKSLAAYPNLTDICAKLDLPLTARPETVTLQQWCALTGALTSLL